MEQTEKQSTTCFHGHDVPWGVPNCPICGATIYPKTEEPEVIIQGDPYKEFDGNVDTAEQSLVTLEQQNELLLKWIVNIKITNPEERKNCSDMLTNAKDAKKDAELKLKEITEPAKLEIERVKGILKPFIDKLDIGIKAINSALWEWDTEQDRLAKEALQKATEQQVYTNTGEIVQVVTQPVSMPTKTTQSHIGSDTRIESFDVVITDPKLIPREYCVPSMSLLRSGFKIKDEIPGAKKVPKNIYQTRRSK